MGYKYKTYSFFHNMVAILLTIISLLFLFKEMNLSLIMESLAWAVIVGVTFRYSFYLKYMDFFIGAVYITASIFVFEWYYIPLITIIGQVIYRRASALEEETPRILYRDMFLTFDWVIELTLSALLVRNFLKIGAIHLEFDIILLLLLCIVESCIGLILIYSDLKLDEKIDSFWGAMKDHLKETWILYFVYFFMVINVAMMYQDYKHIGLAVASSCILTLRIAFDKQAKVDTIEEESFTDPLTGVKNKKFYLEGIPDELKRKTGIMFIDFNGFKKINDTYGHDVGDAVIVHGAHILKSSLRDKDDIIRFGGDEFMLLVRDADISTCEDVINRIEQLCEEMPYSKDGLKLHLKMAVGVAVCPDESTIKDELATIADNKMYVAKQGKNSSQNRVLYKL